MLLTFKSRLCDLDLELAPDVMLNDLFDLSIDTILFAI